jgi:hypothetical protein
MYSVKKQKIWGRWESGGEESIDWRGADQMRCRVQARAEEYWYLKVLTLEWPEQSVEFVWVDTVTTVVDCEGVSWNEEIYTFLIHAIILSDPIMVELRDEVSLQKTLRQEYRISLSESVFKALPKTFYEGPVEISLKTLP